MSRPRILLTGAQGQLGFELARLLAPSSDVTQTDRAELDLENADAIASAMRALRPDLVINAGAYTAVDAAENERERAYAINARAPQVLAEEAKRLGAVLLHYSTDYVFDGMASTPYPESAEPNPLSVYGASKLAGERAITASGAHALVFRTSWVYGLRGQNFLLTIRRLAASRDELRIVADQVGTPNWARALAEATATLVARGSPFLAARSGLYHMSATGATTWHAFACAILGNAPAPRVIPITTAEYPTPARRPAYGVLATQRFRETFGFGLPPWREALSNCLTAEDGTVRPVH